MNPQSAVHHLALRPDAGSHAVLGIVVADSYRGTTLLEHSVEECIEDKLGILLVVADLSAKGKAFLPLRQTEIDCIQFDRVDLQGMDMTVTVDASLGGCREVKKQRLEFHAGTTLQHGGDGILLHALYMYLHHGQVPADGRLVNDSLFYLRLHGVTQHRQLTHQLFVVTAGIKLHNEVATLSTNIGGVRTGVHQQSDVSRTVCLTGVTDGNVVEQTTEAVAVLQV